MKRFLFNFVLLSLVVSAFCLMSGCGKKSVSNKLYPMFKDGKWGYINSQGKIVIEPQFDAAREFHDGLALVSKFDKSGKVNPETNLPEDKDGYIDETGKFVIEPQFVSQRNMKDKAADDFSEGLAIVQTGWTLDKSATPPLLQRNYACIDKTGKVVFKLDPKHGTIENFSDGRLLFRDNVTNKFGFYDKTGKVVIEPKFITAYPFSEGLAAVSDFAKRNGEEFERPYHGFIDADGKTVIDFQFAEAFPFSDGLARVREKDEYYGFIDKTDKMIIKPMFPEAGDFHDGLAVLPRTAWSDFTDKDGKVTAPTTPKGNYTILTDFSGGAALVADSEKKLQVIDKSGKISAPVEAQIEPAQIESLGKNFDEGGIIKILLRDRTLYYINTDGKTVWQGKLV